MSLKQVGCIYIKITAIYHLKLDKDRVGNINICGDLIRKYNMMRGLQTNFYHLWWKKEGISHDRNQIEVENQKRIVYSKQKSTKAS